MKLKKDKLIKDKPVSLYTTEYDGRKLSTRKRNYIFVKAYPHVLLFYREVNGYQFRECFTRKEFNKLRHPQNHHTSQKP